VSGEVERLEESRIRGERADALDRRDAEDRYHDG